MLLPFFCDAYVTSVYRPFHRAPAASAAGAVARHAAATEAATAAAHLRLACMTGRLIGRIVKIVCRHGLP
jgi:uncharacterized membrane protein